MENIDYKLALMEIISMIRDKSTYLKTEDSTSKTYNDDHYEGMKQAYYFVMDGIKEYISSNEEMDEDDFGLKNYDPEEIMKYKPLNAE
jgi:hypothetical protein